MEKLYAKDADYLISKMRNIGIKIASSEIEYTKYLLSTISYSTLVKGMKKSKFIDSNGKFLTEVTIHDVYLIYQINHNFSNLLFKYILVVENILKARIGSYIAVNMSDNTACNKSTSLTDPNDFLYQKYYTTTKPSLPELRFLIKKLSHSKSDAVKHYLSEKNHLPPWIAMNGLYLSDVVKLYDILKTNSKLEIVNSFLIQDNLLTDQEKINLMSSLLRIIKNARNKIAHNESLFVIDFKDKIPENSLSSYTRNIFLDGYSKSETKDLGIFMSVIISCCILISDKLMLNNMIYDIECCINLFEDINICELNVYQLLSIPVDITSRISSWLE